jgi:hypothetical protein
MYVCKVRMYVHTERQFRSACLTIDRSLRHARLMENWWLIIILFGLFFIYLFINYPTIDGSSLDKFCHNLNKDVNVRVIPHICISIKCD